MDAVALLVIIAFVLSGTLTLSEAFSGFSDPNVILIAALFVMGDGLVRTGVATSMGAWLVKVAGSSETRMLVMLMITVAGVAVDDAAQLCRAYQRHDDAGRHAAEPGGEQRIVARGAGGL